LLRHGSVFKIIFQKKKKWYIFGQEGQGLRISKLTDNGPWNYFDELFKS